MESLLRRRVASLEKLIEEEEVLFGHYKQHKERMDDYDSVYQIFGSDSDYDNTEEYNEAVKQYNKAAAKWSKKCSKIRKQIKSIKRWCKLLICTHTAFDVRVIQSFEQIQSLLKTLDAKPRDL